MDWFANMLGAFIGVLIAVPLGPSWLSGSAIRKQFDYWFGTRWLSVTLFILFPFAQIYPQSAWLGMGFLSLDPNRSPNWGAQVINHTIQEGLITGLSWLGVGLFFSLALRPKVPKYTILMTLLAITILIKSLFTALQFGAEDGFIWLSTGAIWGMVLASSILFIALEFPARARLIACIAAFIGLMALVNYFPDNPYFAMSLPRLGQSRLMHFNDLMQWLSWIWLPVALVWLVHHAVGAKR
jgi:hypothetical protein